MRRIRFVPQADAEVAAETRYYRREAGPEIASQFVKAVEQASCLAAEFPAAGSPSHANTRRIQLKKFPFSLIYQLAEDEIVVFAVAHNARKPGYWESRTTRN